MNLITCSKDCAHQYDGYCKLENTNSVNQYKVDGCCYYQKRKYKNRETEKEQRV